MRITKEDNKKIRIRTLIIKLVKRPVKKFEK